jgi:hypothetical protein
MAVLGARTQRLLLIVAMVMASGTLGGCKLVGQGFNNAWDFSKFWVTTPLIPVTPYFSQLIEDTYWEEERYDRVEILDPVEGENAPIFCMDLPSQDEIMRTLPDDTSGSFPFLAETRRNNVRMTIEPIVDSLGECRFYPMVGPAKLHKCHFKCTVTYTKTIQSSWPIPFMHTEDVEEVVYIDHDHLIRCADPGMGW